MRLDDWFLAKGERGNDHTAIDRRHGDVPWTEGNLAEVLIDEKGAPVPIEGRFILTGTKLDGSPTGKSCNDWASADKNANTSFGDADPGKNQTLGSGWNFARQNATNNNTSNCTTAGLTDAKSQGRIFCFATD